MNIIAYLDMLNSKIEDIEGLQQINSMFLSNGTQEILNNTVFNDEPGALAKFINVVMKCGAHIRDSLVN